MSKSSHAKLPEYRVPAVCRLPLSSVLLQLLNRGHIVNTESAGDVLAEFLSPPPSEHIEQDVLCLERLHFSVSGRLTNTGRAAAELHMPVEDAMVLLSGALLGVGQLAALLLSATASDRLVEALCHGKFQHKRRKVAWVTKDSCDLLYLARAMEHHCRAGDRSCYLHTLPTAWG